jgi:putative PIN family toxin of toxin-antitoxin system
VRIVADTNVVLSGLLWRGPPSRLIQLGRQGAVDLCSSVELVTELAEVIGRAKFRLRLAELDLVAELLVQGYASLAEIHEPTPLANSLSRDPDDDKVIACAISAGAQMIVSGDRDLLDLGSIGRIQIATAGQAVATIEQQVQR